MLPGDFSLNTDNGKVWKMGFLMLLRIHLSVLWRWTKNTTNYLNKTSVNKVFLVIDMVGRSGSLAAGWWQWCFHSLCQGPGITLGLTWHDHLGTGHGNVLLGPQPWSFIHMFHSPSIVMLGRPRWMQKRALPLLSLQCADRDVHTNSCSISWEGPESTLTAKKGSLDRLCILACISTHLSSFPPLIMKFLTV